MTTSLKKAFEKAASLPKEAQEQLAEQLLEDLRADAKWDDTLERSQPLLERLAKRALQQKRAGKVRRKGIDEL